jgi:hypothetical protein
MNEKIKPLTADAITGDITAVKALIEKYAPHLPGAAHLINSVGALRQAAYCLENHLAAAAKPSAFGETSPGGGQTPDAKP